MFCYCITTRFSLDDDGCLYLVLLVILLVIAVLFSLPPNNSTGNLSQGAVGWGK